MDDINAILIEDFSDWAVLNREYIIKFPCMCEIDIIDNRYVLFINGKTENYFIFNHNNAPFVAGIIWSIQKSAKHE